MPPPTPLAYGARGRADDDLVAAIVERLSERTADAAGPAGDEDCVACSLHGSCLSVLNCRGCEPYRPAMRRGWA
jgi:hypothetical protein